MAGETIIVAALSFLGGGGASRLARALGPTRDRNTVAYYRGIAESLEKENRRLWKRVGTLVKAVEQLEEKTEGIATLERQVGQIANGELPAEYS